MMVIIYRELWWIRLRSMQNMLFNCNGDQATQRLWLLKLGSWRCVFDTKIPLKYNEISGWCTSTSPCAVHCWGPAEVLLLYIVELPSFPDMVNGKFCPGKPSVVAGCPRVSKVDFPLPSWWIIHPCNTVVGPLAMAWPCTAGSACWWPLQKKLRHDWMTLIHSICPSWPGAMQPWSISVAVRVWICRSFSVVVVLAVEIWS